MSTPIDAFFNNTTTSILPTIVDPTCPDREWYTETGKRGAFIVYYIVTPSYFVLGVLCHGLSLVAFFKQCRKEKAYIYQVFITGCELVEVCTTFLYAMLFQWWASPLRPGPGWYRSCYACMFWSAHFSIPVQNVFLTMSQLFLVFMCADRVYALWRPYGYKSTNQRRNFTITLIFCIVVGILVNAFSFFRFYVHPIPNLTVEGQQLYEVASEAIFTGSLLGNVLNQTRNAVWALCLVLLYVLNGVLIYFYRTKVTQAKLSKAVTTTTASEKRKQEAERTLILIALFQSIFNTSSMTAFLIYSTVVYVYPSFYLCKGAFFVPLTDAVFQIFDLLDFVGVFCVSKQFRTMIKKAFWCMRKVGASGGSGAGGGGAGSGTGTAVVVRLN